MVMFDLGSKFLTHSYTASLIITMEPRTKCRIHAAAMLFFYILEKNCLDKGFIFFEVLLLYLICFKKKALTVLRGPLAYPNGLLD